MSGEGANREKYAAQADPYNAVIQKMVEEEKDILQAIEEGAVNAAELKITLADLMLDLLSHYLALNGLHKSILRSNDEEALNGARKALYKSISYLEEVVTHFVDTAYADYKDKLQEIDSVTPKWRYFFVRKLGLSIDMVQRAYADNIRWKWAFEELKGRFAAVVKNLINLDRVNANTDPRSPHYEPTVLHLRLAIKLLEQSAVGYRKKYEISSNSVNDFNKGLHFLDALRRLLLVIGKADEAEILKKKTDAWKGKLAADIANGSAKST